MTNYRRKKKPVIVVEEKQYAVNRQIKATQVRILGEDGIMLGVFSIKDALALAVEKEADLVEINPKGEMPVCKLINYSKFKYQQDKKAIKQKVEKIKTIRVSVNIAVNDLQVQSKKALEFLSKDVKVKLQVKMERREKSHPEVAKEVIGQFVKMIGEENFEYENTPNLVADSYVASIKPLKKAKAKSEVKTEAKIEVKPEVKQTKITVA
jgi:translation initiation factor IF-3